MPHSTDNTTTILLLPSLSRKKTHADIRSLVIFCGNDSIKNFSAINKFCVLIIIKHGFISFVIDLNYGLAFSSALSPAENLSSEPFQVFFNHPKPSGNDRCTSGALIANNSSGNLVFTNRKTKYLTTIRRVWHLPSTDSEFLRTKSNKLQISSEKFAQIGPDRPNHIVYSLPLLRVLYKRCYLLYNFNL
jgi:hypothetical protein